MSQKNERDGYRDGKKNVNYDPPRDTVFGPKTQKDWDMKADYDAGWREGYSDRNKKR